MKNFRNLLTYMSCVAICMMLCACPSDSEDIHGNILNIENILKNNAWTTDVDYDVLVYGKPTDQNVSFDREKSTYYFLNNGKGVVKTTKRTIDTYFGSSTKNTVTPFSWYVSEDGNIHLGYDSMWRLEGDKLVQQNIGSSYNYFQKRSLTSDEIEFMKQQQIACDMEGKPVNVNVSLNTKERGHVLIGSNYYYPLTPRISISSNEHLLTRGYTHVEVTLTIVPGTGIIDGKKSKVTYTIFVDKDVDIDQEFGMSLFVTGDNPQFNVSCRVWNGKSGEYEDARSNVYKISVEKPSYLREIEGTGGTSGTGSGSSSITDGEKKTFTVNGVSFSMIPVKAGTFQMGSSTYSDEQPVHSVTITKDYYIGETEVTQGLWKAVTGYSPTSRGSQWSSTYGLGDSYPAYYISYEDVLSFITKLNSITGQTFRMPTEAEWEYAARGGNKSKGYTYSGSNTIGNVAWYDSNSNSKAHPVKTKSPNELGIYDMTGNVREWCVDWYSSTYYSVSPSSDPTGPTSGSTRVYRGGGWGYTASSCRSAYRDFNTPAYRSYYLGFRLALSPSK